MKFSKPVLIVLMVLACLSAVGIILSIGVYGYANTLRTEGIALETQLTAQYLSNQNNLASYISGFYEQLGIVKFKSEKLDQILADYAKGRNFAANGQSNQASFINAVHEAVPDLTGLNIADRMIDYVQAGRESYKAIQDKLLDQLRSYDRWRADGFVQSYIVANFLGIPSERLEARIGSDIARGAAARDRMFTIVLAQQAKDAYVSGTLAPLEVK